MCDPLLALRFLMAKYWVPSALQSLTVPQARKAQARSKVTQSRAQLRDRQSPDEPLDPAEPKPEAPQDLHVMCIDTFPLVWFGCWVGFWLPARAKAQTKILLFGALAVHVGGFLSDFPECLAPLGGKESKFTFLGFQFSA